MLAVSWSRIFCFPVCYSKTKIIAYKTIILIVVFCGCEIWSVMLREKLRLKVFDNRVLRGIFRPKRGEVTGDWKKIHNKLNDL